MKEGLIKVIKFLSAFLLWYSGIAIIYRFIFNCLCGNPVTILCIHRVIDRTNGKSNLAKLYLKIGHLELSDLNKKLRFLKKKFKVISFNEYLDVREGGGHLPPNSCVLTFDDGDLEHYTKVYPLLKKLKLPATFFIPTAYISNNDCKWDDKIAAFIVGTKIKEFEFNTPLLAKKIFKIGTIDGKAKATTFLCGALKYVSAEMRKDFIRKLVEMLHLDDNWGAVICPRVMEWDQVRTIANDPLMSIGAHTQTHPVLTMLSEQEIEDEFRGCKQELEENIGRSVTLFSYPFGKCRDFNEKIKGITEKAGFQAACSFCYGRNDKGSDRFALKRIPLLSESLCVFKARMSGIFDFISAQREARKR
jgi:peptidoglycan/xylan/chitin deacetylase (PgdA/CDA1 family)